MAETYNSLLTEFDEVSVLAGFKSLLLQEPGNRRLNMRAALFC